MKLLLHTCCGPCSIYPLEQLRRDHDISAFFFNPNIHPYLEFKRRQETLLTYCEAENIPVVDKGEYGLTEYLRKVAYSEEVRCRICYQWRMEETAKRAAQDGFEGFSTTLLYSRFQDHEELKKCGFELAYRYGITYVYEDLRAGWQYGIDKSREYAMYRQPYCGCIFSEQDRYDPAKRKKKTTKK